MVRPEDIKQWIEAGLRESRAEVSGDGHHFEARIVSPAFEDLNSVRRHQLVYQALGDKMREAIHALSMQTLTPTEASATKR